MRFKSIATRIFVLIVPTVIATVILFAVLSYNLSSSRINDTFNQKMHESLGAADLEIQLELYKNSMVAINFASYGKRLTIDSFNHKEHEEFLAEVIRSNGNTFGGGVWFEPRALDPNSYYFGPFLYIGDDGGVVYVPDYGMRVDYFNEDWYIKGKNSGSDIVWSNVYYDPVSQKTMITASKPFYDDTGKFIGMGTADMKLDNIREIVNRISVGETGKAFILGSGGEYISFYDMDKSVNDTMQADADKELAKLGRELIRNDSGITSFEKDGKKLRVYYMTMENTNWTLAISIEESEINSSTLYSVAIMSIVPVLGLLLIILGSYELERYLRKIVNKVNDFADMAASGHFSERIEVTEADEFGRMERYLNKMISNMSDMSEHSAELLKMAENASKAKSEFLSRMSHEIRTPMNAIIGMTQIAEASSDPQKIKSCLDKVETASKHLLSLVNDILDMSKIEANKLELAEEEFDPADSLENVCDMMLVKTEEKSQKLTLSVDENLPRSIIGDELRFNQVVTNLVGNAIKFTQANGVISVTAREEEREGSYSVIKVCIRDTGIGLSPEQQQKLFQSFEQGDGSVSRKFGGTGLGLAISKRIVEMMNGSIWVESELGKGSAFMFTINVPRGPNAYKHIEEDSPKKESHGAKNLEDSDFSGKTMLLAEDVEINREIIFALLENTGLNIEIAENGIQATDMYRDRPDKYDLIMMDIQMPEMDGYEATRLIRQMNVGKSATVPIIAMTANAMKEDVRMCLDAGMNDHIAKPIEIDDLFIKLNNYINK